MLPGISVQQTALPVLFRACRIPKSGKSGSSPFLFQTVSDQASPFPIPPYYAPLANSSVLYFPPGGRISTLKRLSVLPYELGCCEIYTH